MLITLERWKSFDIQNTRPERKQNKIDALLLSVTKKKGYIYPSKCMCYAKYWKVRRVDSQNLRKKDDDTLLHRRYLINYNIARKFVWK